VRGDVGVDLLDPHAEPPTGAMSAAAMFRDRLSTIAFGVPADPIRPGFAANGERTMPT
jgi:hypothetical protein